MCSRPLTMGSLLVLATVLVAVVAASDKMEKQKLFRVARSFPYSLAYMRMMRPAQSSIRPVASYEWLNKAEADNELAEFIDSIDANNFIDGRERRSTGPVYKRYACRFKFCRIFDA
ncbi:unnamed protein product [Bursaphelenchus okinawaensis]|uniref:Uncharacterized protein n=1 Tax=Bursaphelenchus okinawaensis TaxID=465554 RepID=A0A811LJ30_9BILA|nr:unnamed protein product [Bursaphelenchus okinawaensis]CAG9127047.1 unnamed protein product [Bursaphelenchus okinawaensis]